MKLPQLFKPKAPTLPYRDWIDSAAVQALHDTAAAAVKINEPMVRLVALKTAADMIGLVLAAEDKVFKTAVPLTSAGQQEMAAYIDNHGAQGGIAIFGMLGVALSGTMIIGFAGFLLGLPLMVAAGFAFFPASLGVIGPLLDKAEKPFSEALGDLHDVTKQLQGLHTRLQESINDIENSATLADARQSSHLDAALDLSPSLRQRFGEEATRAAIRGDAKPEEIRIIAKPIRRDLTI